MRLFSLLLLSALIAPAALAANAGTDADTTNTHLTQAATVAEKTATPIPSTPQDTDDNLLKAALKGWHVKLSAGFNVGGMSPLPLPVEIRKINSFKPGLQLAIEGDAQRRFEGSHWGGLVGVRLETKGMTTDATVKNYHMEMTADDGGFMEGAWTGRVKTEVSTYYLTFPILATYAIGERWQLSAGPYLSWMFKGEFGGEVFDGYIRHHDPTGEKAEVTHATYDFDHDLRHFAWGLQVGADFAAYKHLLVGASLQWGLNSVFPADFDAVTFKMFPIYGNIHFSYLF